MAFNNERELERLASDLVRAAILSYSSHTKYVKPGLWLKKHESIFKPELIKELKSKHFYHRLK